MPVVKYRSSTTGAFTRLPVGGGPAGDVAAAIAAHEAKADPHPQYATEAYVDSRTPDITVGSTPPEDPEVGDIWLDTS